jgi:hypothetical protein
MFPSGVTGGAEKGAGGAGDGSGAGPGSPASSHGPQSGMVSNSRSSPGRVSSPPLMTSTGPGPMYLYLGTYASYAETMVKTSNV